jgi:integrative and conjugative element protein (TIGR02256 family)
MRHLADWACPNTGVIVVLARSVLQTFTRFIQNEDKPEAGGILLGYRRGDHFEVVHATEPTQFDTQSRHHFKRESEIHAKAASDMWASSHGHIGYIGEWHTHPESTPSPSCLDLKEWMNLTMKVSDKTSMVMTIVGTKEIWIGLSHPNGSICKLISVI